MYLRGEVDDNRNDFQVFNQNKDKVSYDKHSVKTVFEHGCDVKMVVHLQSMWFVSEKYGLKIMAKQGRVWPSKGFSDGYNNTLDEDDDEEVVKRKEMENLATDSEDGEKEVSDNESE